jgi:transmembrane sensor
VSRLRHPIKEGLVNPTSEEALARIWRKIDARDARERPNGRERVRIWGVTSLVAAAAMAVAVWGIERRDRGPLRFADGRPLVAAIDAPAAGALLSLSDGSTVDLSGGARLEPLESSGTSFVAALARGSAHFEVHPGGPRRWEIECGLATVEVVGTGFDCARAPGRLRVTVEHGAVLVRGERVPDRARRLAAGEWLEVLEAPGAPTIVPAPSAPPPAPTDVAAPAANVEAPAAPAAGGSGWRELARGGHNREAFAALGAQGISRETRRRGAADLFVLADVARLSGHPGDAVAPLERILRRFPGDPQAPLAALTLGRLELDDLQRPADAAAALNRALTLDLPRSLREDVRARLVEAYDRAGDRSAAQQAAAAYLREFPNGRDLGIVQSHMR